MTGFINVNKAAGASSAKEVAVIKRLTHTPCGHMGTLDPMADGVLPVAIGNAARLFDYFLKKKKTYVATFRFGEEFDTLDTTGTVINGGGRVPSAEEILAVIPNLSGEVLQVPPIYSAKNVNGKRGYELARSGVQFELPPKKVLIESIKLLREQNGNEFVFEIECGGGTYIRSIARDMAKSLGTYAAMSALTRTKSGIFTIENSVSTAALTADNVQDYIIPCDSVLPYESVYVSGRDAKKVFNGVPLPCDYGDGDYKLYNEDCNFYGIATVCGGVLKVRTKLC
ncbi:MAG: tRNA pseudouridine(55) synthase TruB [Clostridiales bacterium]|nr:tRNA pseudouridine(55) synthase TruB [Clostridiales bacterium]